MALTPMQQYAVDERNRPLLIAAAAGSGKTSVLSKRVVAMLAGDGGHPPIDADRMMIVTFTRLASAELRERITNELEERAAKQPNDENLRRQRRLLPQAQISTIDSLCRSILQQNFEKAGVSAELSVLQGGALKQLESEVLTELLESEYEKMDADFIALRELCENGSDDTIREIIYETYLTAKAEPDLQLWIESCKLQAEQYRQQLYQKEAAAKRDIFAMRDEILRAEFVDDFAGMVFDILENPARKNKNFEKEAPKRQAIVAEHRAWEDAFRGAFSELADAGEDLSSIASALVHAPQKTRKGKEKYIVEHPEGQKLLAVWTQMVDLRKTIDAYAVSDMAHDQKIKQAVEKVYALVIAYEQRLMDEKRRLGRYSFADIEQMTVSLLAKGHLTEDGAVEFKATEAASEIAAQYDCVMVDECQDNSGVQDVIFRMLTEGTDHLFMVGDIKQSIYRFRHAKPELFLNRLEQYADVGDAKDGMPVRVLLKDNFRSRSSVIDTVNYLFARVMSKAAGEITYDASAAMLSSAVYPPMPYGFSADTELHLLDNLKSKENDYPAIDQEEYTAALIAKMIAEGYPVTDRKTGEMRPCRYSDFMVLMRSKTKLSRLLKELDRHHISYHTGSIKAFYQTTEIADCLAMLKVSINPQQDEALWRFLLSPFCRFDFDDAARLRLIANETEGSYLYDALLAAGQSDDPLQPKAKAALELLQQLSNEALRRSVSDFLQYAYAISSYPALLAAGEDGAQKNANLDLLCKDSKNWEADHFGGIDGFLRYVDRMLEESEDIEPASALYQNEDVVEVMTIHGSKGLEAPICILCHCEARFNQMDTKGGYLLDAKYGLTLQYSDEQNCISYYNAYGEKIKESMSAQLRAEEMRLLYVAMTRAREKLICIGSVNHLNNDLTKMNREIAAALKEGDEDPYLVPRAYTSGASNYLKWLMAGLLSDPAAAEKLNSMGYEVMESVPYSVIGKKLGDTARDKLQFSVVVCRADEPRNALLESSTPTLAEFASREADDAQVKRLLKPYRYENVTLIPAKSSVTALTHRGVYPKEMDLFRKKQEELLLRKTEDVVYEADVEPTESDPLAEAGLKKPAFMLEEEGRITGAMRGNAAHNFLQYANFADAKKDLEAEIDRLVGMQFITEQDGALVNRYTVSRFLRSKLCARILTAEKEGRLLREYAFIHELPVSEADASLGDTADGEMIVVQGIADCILVDEDGLVLIDYKTDRLDEPQAFVMRYREQLRIYREALCCLFADYFPGKPAVKKTLIYSLHLGAEIEIE